MVSILHLGAEDRGVSGVLASTFAKRQTGQEDKEGEKGALGQVAKDEYPGCDSFPPKTLRKETRKEKKNQSRPRSASPPSYVLSPVYELSVLSVSIIT